MSTWRRSRRWAPRSPGRAALSVVAPSISQSAECAPHHLRPSTNPTHPHTPTPPAERDPRHHPGRGDHAAVAAAAADCRDREAGAGGRPDDGGHHQDHQRAWRRPHRHHHLALRAGAGGAVCSIQQSRHRGIACQRCRPAACPARLLCRALASSRAALPPCMCLCGPGAPALSPLDPCCAASAPCLQAAFGSKTDWRVRAISAANLHLRVNHIYVNSGGLHARPTERDCLASLEPACTVDAGQPGWGAGCPPDTCAPEALGAHTIAG